MAHFPNERREQLSKREAILRSNGMESASPADAELFWRRYNEGRRRLQWKALTIGDIAGRWLRKEVTAAGGTIGLLKRVWTRAVPGEWQGRCGIEGFSKGTVRVVVDAKSTAFVLRRRVEKVFVEALKSEAPDLKVNRVIYRIGARA